MAKKRKKKSRSQRKRRGPRLSPTQLAQPSAAPTAAQAGALGLPAAEPSDLREEYRYVVTDLKRIAIIAVVMMVVMIALALLTG